MKGKGRIVLFLWIIVSPAIFAQKDSTALRAASNLKRFKTFYFESIKHRAMENPDLALRALSSAERIPELNQEQKSAIAYEQAKNFTLLEDFDRAILAYQQALIHPDFKMAAQINLYDIYHKQGAYQKALTVVKALSKVDENYCVDLIKLNMETGDLERAQVILDSITHSWGSSLELQSIRLELQKRNAQQQNSALDTGFNPEDYRRFMELLQAQALDQALELMALIVSAQDLAPIQKAQAVEAFAAQSPDKQYQEVFERLIPQLERAESGLVEVALGRYFLDRLDIEKAQNHGQKALALEPNSKDALLLLASVAYASGDYPSGLAYAEMALGLYPADPWCYLLVARGYRYSDMLDLAEMQIMSGLEFTLAGSNQFRLLCTEASAIYLALGKEKEAQLWLDKIGQ